MFVLAVIAIQSTASGQSPTTAPSVPPVPSPGQAPLDADPNRMAEDALALTDIGTKEAMEKAAEIVDKLRKIAPQTQKLYLACARLLAADGKGPQAIRYYEQYKTMPDGKTDYRPYAEMGRLYMRSKRLRTARRLLEDAKQLAPEQEPKTGKFIRAEISMDLANVLLQLEDKEEAVRVAREAATQATSDSRIQIVYSRLLLSVNPQETKEARDIAARAVAMLLKDLEADSFSIPKLQMLREALTVVENTWATEAGMQDSNPEPVHFLSIATQEVAEISQRLALVAAREYELRAIELNKNKAEYKLRLAEIEAQMGAINTAGYTLDAVLKADPENKEALALKERIATMPVRKIGVAAGL